MFTAPWPLRGLVRRTDVHVVVAGGRAAVRDLAVDQIAFNAVGHHVDGHRAAHARAIARHAERAGKAHDHLGGFRRHVHAARVQQVGHLADARLDVAGADVDGNRRAHARLAVRAGGRARHGGQPAQVARRDGDVARRRRGARGAPAFAGLHAGAVARGHHGVRGLAVACLRAPGARQPAQPEDPGGAGSRFADHGRGTHQEPGPRRGIARTRE
ncbi:hypothetical protein G6F50_014610 [Rhizopus delemar]|uniref:Uncharacterized protein n=1 Tax=Rhizopus delemar TaxID=936053 RepID=A0A9P7C716_9FUNG|nr:hypothetical protein G6F50_014610 [Rhizopus delemar]